MARIISILLILASTLFVTVASEEESHDFALVGYWQFEEGGGSIAKDSSPNQADGEIRGTAVWTEGKIGKAIRFNGKDTQVYIPRTPLMDDPKEITLEAWIKFADENKEGGIIEKTQAYRLMVAKSNNLQSPYCIFFDIQDENKKWHRAFSTQILETEKWYYVVGTFDSFNKVIRLYIDGKVVSEISIPEGTKIIPIKSGLHIGVRDHKSFFNGVIDEVRVLIRALTPEEVSERYKKYIISN